MAKKPQQKPLPKNKLAVKSQEKSVRKREPARETYALTFNTRGAGLVKAINALALCERFVVVEEFGFHRTKDALGEALGDSKKEAESQTSVSTRRNRRNRGKQEADQPVKAEETSSIVSDPSNDEPMSVTLSVSVYDFGSLEEEGK